MAEELYSAPANKRTVPRVWHRCRRCGRFFRYRYDPPYAALHLLAIDYICRGCLAVHLESLEAAVDEAH